MKIASEDAGGPSHIVPLASPRDSGIDIAALNMMLDASVDCIKFLNRDGTIGMMNRSGCEALGVPRGGPFGMKWLPLLPPEVRDGGRRALRACLTGKRASFAGKSQLPGLPPVYWDNILTPVCDEGGYVTAVLCLSRDITRQRVAEQKLRFASDNDALTGIPNRRFLNRVIEKRMKQAHKHGSRLGLLLIDLDGLKTINDAKGHDAGDAAIWHIGRALDHASGTGLFPARLGGDEFAVLATNIQAMSELEDIATRLVEKVGDGVVHAGQQIPTRLSVGGALTSNTIQTRAELFKAADLALYEAKAAGRSTIWIDRANS